MSMAFPNASDERTSSTSAAHLMKSRYLHKDDDATTLNQGLRHHAVASTLSHKKGLIEVYDLYRFPLLSKQTTNDPKVLKKPVAAAVIKVGNLLDGPSGIVHGGIAALLFDDIMGFASVPMQPWSVTKDLKVEYKQPHPHNSYVVIRVYIDDEKMAAFEANTAQTINHNSKPLKKRLFLKATCRSLGRSTPENAPSDDGEDDPTSSLFSTATITMVQVRTTPISAADAALASKQASSSQPTASTPACTNTAGVTRISRFHNDDMIAKANQRQTASGDLYHHAMASTLSTKEGLIEVYDLYRFPIITHHNTIASSSKPIAAAVIKVGNLLDGPAGTVHGGIVAFIFDDVLSFAGAPIQPWSVTKDLKVEYKLPQPHKSYVIIRVYIDHERRAAFEVTNQSNNSKNNSAKKPLKERLFLRATCRSLAIDSSNNQKALLDGEEAETLFSTATITMVQVKSKPPSARDFAGQQQANRLPMNNDGSRIMARL